MDYGLILPSLGDDASVEGIEAACEAAEQLGYGDVWVTDHVLVDTSEGAADYRRIFEAVTTLAYVAARTERVRIGSSVIVVPMRNAVVLAKELATIDALSRGRLIVGVGVGWNEVEFGHLGVEDRFAARGAYMEEAIRLFRHLWSGSTEPFHGRFHAFDDFAFGPLPPQGAKVPIWIGGRTEKALERVGRLADAYHASATRPSAYAERIPIIRAAADSAGRAMPKLSARVRVEMDREPSDRFYALRGSPAAIAAEVRAFADLGVDHLAIQFPERDPAGLARTMERFIAEIAPLV